MRQLDSVFFIRLDEHNKFAPKTLQHDVVLKSEKIDYKRQLSSISTDTISDKVTARSGVFHQILATCAVLLLATACGMPSGFSAVLLPQLTTANTTADIPIDIEMGSWIASVASLSNPMGALISGSLSDYIGRRATLLVSVLPLFIGWTVLALSQSYSILIVGRFIGGFAVGMLGGPAHVYIAETTEPNLRSLLIGAPFVAYSLGILIVYALGTTLHWRTVAWWGNLLPALAVIAMFCIPETPTWLIRNKKLLQAEKALTFLRGNEITAQKELNEMNARQQMEQDLVSTKENIFKLCCQRIAIKPLVIIILLSFLQMISGTFLVVFYAVDIISELGASFDAKVAATWTAVVRTICTMIFCVVLVFVRRRRILIISGIGSGLSCLVLSVYMYVRLNQSTSSADVIVAASCMLIYIAFNTALMVMPGIMVGELLPSKIRGCTAGGLFAAMNVALFGLTKAFPFIWMGIGLRGIFMMFAVASFLISVTMCLLQPETKGRTLEQIEDYFKEDHWFWFKRNRSQTIAGSESATKKDDKA